MDEYIFYLDLNKVTLLGWEQRNLFSKVEEMVNAIESGDNFPAVPVKKINENTYRLTMDRLYEWGRCDGGHHRAIAHYIANKPLLCRKSREVLNREHFIIELANLGRFNIPQSEIDYICKFSGFFPISQAILVDKLPETIDIPLNFLD